MSIMIIVNPSNSILQQKIPVWFLELLRGEYIGIYIPPHINDPDEKVTSMVAKANEQLEEARRQYNAAIEKIGQEFFSGEAALQMQSITHA